MRSPCIVVERERGEDARLLLSRMGMIRRDLRIKCDGGHVYIPVRERIDIGYGRMAEEDFEEIAARKIPDVSYEIIGDICILREDVSEEVAHDLLRGLSVKVVVKPVKPVGGEFRTRSYVVVAGERRTETLHREYGLKFLVDLNKAYFNPHLVNERLRVASMVGGDETVLDMFAGIGCFSIHVARRARKVIAVDKNPHAIEYLRRNLQLNNVHNVIPIQADVSQVVKYIERSDRVLLDFPSDPLRFISAAEEGIKHGGFAHVYAILNENSVEEWERKLDGWIVKGRRKLKSYAPNVYIFGFDLVRK